MIKSVVRSFNWNQQEIESLYLDDADFRGLEYWHNDIVEVNKPTEDKNKRHKNGR